MLLNHRITLSYLYLTQRPQQAIKQQVIGKQCDSKLAMNNYLDTACWTDTFRAAFAVVFTNGVELATDFLAVSYRQ